MFWDQFLNLRKYDQTDSLNLVWITDDEQRLEEDQEDDSEGPQPTPFNPLIFWPAALCDMTATSIQYIALTLTYASSFQMLRGKTKQKILCVFYQLCGFIFPIILLHPVPVEGLKN